jgi:hypothetical protein
MFLKILLQKDQFSTVFPLDPSSEKKRVKNSTSENEDKKLPWR